MSTFALLFDRKSGTLTALAVSAITLLVFAAGCLVGAQVDWSRLGERLGLTQASLETDASGASGELGKLEKMTFPKLSFGRKAAATPAPAAAAPVTTEELTTGGGTSDGGSPPGVWVPFPKSPEGASTPAATPPGGGR